MLKCSRRTKGTMRVLGGVTHPRKCQASTIKWSNMKSSPLIECEWVSSSCISNYSWDAQGWNLQAEQKNTALFYYSDDKSRLNRNIYFFPEYPEIFKEKRIRSDLSLPFLQHSYFQYRQWHLAAFKEFPACCIWNLWELLITVLHSQSFPKPPLI